MILYLDLISIHLQLCSWFLLNWVEQIRETAWYLLAEPYAPRTVSFILLVVICNLWRFVGWVLQNVLVALCIVLLRGVVHFKWLILTWLHFCRRKRRDLTLPLVASGAIGVRFEGRLLHQGRRLRLLDRRLLIARFALCILIFLRKSAQPIPQSLNALLLVGLVFLGLFFVLKWVQDCLLGEFCDWRRPRFFRRVVHVELRGQLFAIFA